MNMIKKAFTLCIAVAMLLPLFGGVFTAAAENSVNMGLNILGGTLEFVNDETYPWTYDITDIGHYGAKAGNGGVANSTSTISLTHTFGENEGISFYWRVSSQDRWDTFTFAIDGEPMEVISGNLEWDNKVIPIEAGEHTLTWSYSKDDRYDLYQDRAALDEVEIVKLTPNNGYLDKVISPEGLFSFETDQVNPWVIHRFNAGYAAKSTVEGKSGAETAITLRQTLEKGKVLNFMWQVDCENVWDRFIFEVNGEEVDSITGYSAYKLNQYVIEETGDYVFRWVYKKDGMVDRGADSAYLGSVSVTDYAPVTGIVLMRSTSTTVGGNATVVSNIKPSNATNKAVVWSSSDESVVTVDQNGIITGVSIGTAQVTATTVEGNMSASCNVTVNNVKHSTVYYVDAINGSDRNKGVSPRAPFRSLELAVETAHTQTGIVRIVLLSDVAVSSEMRVDNAKVNVTADDGKYYKISRARGYTDAIFNVALGGEFYIGNIDGNGGVSIGHSVAEAPALLVDMGKAYMYAGSDITNNISEISGAGVYVNAGSFVLLGGSISGNETARFGGGIYADGGRVSVYQNASVSGNSAVFYGGGFFVGKDAEAYIADGTVAENTASKGYNDVCYENELPNENTEYTSADGRFVYRIDYDKNGIEIIGWTPAQADFIEGAEEGLCKLEIPSLIDGYTVISIGKNAFREDGDEGYQLCEVALPATVKSIGYGAFRGCKRLVSVSFGEVESIGDYAFYQCEALESAELPESVKTVGYGAFSYCPSLKKVTVNNEAAFLGDYAFYMTAEGFTLRGHYPSTAYTYALENETLFEDILPYAAPTVSGVEDGGVYNLYSLVEGVAIGWESEYPTEALLNSEAYVAGTPITEVGEYVFTVTDGRSSVTVSFTLVYDEPDIPGDIDADGKITVSDSLLILRAAAGISEVTPDILAIADIDGDGAITVSDALSALRTAIFS